MSIPACIIVVHPPPTFAIPSSPVPAFTTAQPLTASRRPRQSGILDILGALQPFSQPSIDVAADQHLLPPNKSSRSRPRSRKARTAKAPKLSAGRGWCLPDPWTTVTDPTTGIALLIPAAQPGDAPTKAHSPLALAFLSIAAGRGPPPVDAFTRVHALAPGRRPSLVGLKDPRLVPYFEWMVYILLVLFHLPLVFRA